MADGSGSHVRSTGSPVVHGFPHLETVRSAITALYRRLSYDGVRGYATSLSPSTRPSPTRTICTSAPSGWRGRWSSTCICRTPA